MVLAVLPRRRYRRLEPDVAERHWHRVRLQVGRRCACVPDALLRPEGRQAVAGLPLQRVDARRHLPLLMRHAMKNLSLFAIAALAGAISAGCQSPPSRPERPQGELFAARDAENAGRSRDFNALMDGFLKRAHNKTTMAKAGSPTP